MNKFYQITALTLVCIVFFAGHAVAYDVCLSCESVQQIYVGKGRRHLAGGKTEIFYAADVILNTATSNLEEAYAECPGDTIVIRLGNGVFELPKDAISPAGNWFGIDRATPQEALDAAMSMCPDKVESDLDD